MAISKSELVKTPNYTMTSWLRIQDSPTDGNIGRVIFSNYSNLHGSIFYIKTNNKIALRPHGMNTNIDFASNTDLQYNQWYFVSATFNGSTANLYINGKLDGTASFIWYDPIDSGIA